jgi:hypothetical protein
LGHSSTESTPILVVARPLAIEPTSPAIDPTPDANVYLGILTDQEGTVAGRIYSVTDDWSDC